MAFEDIIDSNTKDIKINITDDMRAAAAEVVKRYNELRLDVKTSRLVSLEGTIRSAEFEDLMAHVHTANPHLNPQNMAGTWLARERPWRHKEDMRTASDGPLNALLAEEAAKLGMEAPKPFNEFRVEKY